MTPGLIPVIDGHNDLASACREKCEYSASDLDSETHSAHNHLQTDIPKLRRGGVRGQFWSAWVHSDVEGSDAVQATLEQIDFLHRMVAKYPDDLRWAVTAAEVIEANESGLIASLIGVEGGNQMNNSLPVLRCYARAGVRYMTLTWNMTVEWADAAVGLPTHNGLTDRGREIIREMNRIGMIVDLSHVSAATMSDALDVATLPLIFSHSSCFALNPHPRNAPDDIIRRVTGNGGVLMITFVPAFISPAYWAWEVAGSVGAPPVVTVADVADHVEHARAVAGVDHIGIGGDFDGSEQMPEGLGTVADYPNLFSELWRRGWTREDLMKLGSTNVFRVLKANDACYARFLGEGNQAGSAVGLRGARPFGG